MYNIHNSISKIKVTHYGNQILFSPTNHQSPKHTTENAHIHAQGLIQFCGPKLITIILIKKKRTLWSSSHDPLQPLLTVHSEGIRGGEKQDTGLGG